MGSVVRFGEVSENVLLEKWQKYRQDFRQIAGKGNANDPVFRAILEAWQEAELAFSQEYGGVNFEIDTARVFATLNCSDYFAYRGESGDYAPLFVKILECEEENFVILFAEKMREKVKCDFSRAAKSKAKMKILRRDLDRFCEFVKIENAEQIYDSLRQNSKMPDFDLGWA